MNDYQVKLIKNKKSNKNALPPFSITYKTKDNDQVTAGYDILSCLKGDNDIIVEVNGSIVFGNDIDSEKLTLGFLSHIREIGLDYTVRQIMIPPKQTFFSLLLPGHSKETQSNEILAYVPDSVWKQDAFKKALPLHGARYYIIKHAEDPKELLDNMSRMTDREKVQYFKLITYHAAVLRKFGIQSEHINESDLRDILNI